MKNTLKPFYDLDTIKAIPIENVCEVYSFDVTNKGKTVWCNVRGERTPSCKIFTDTNTFCDFGNGNIGGDVISFVCYAEGWDLKDRGRAIQRLADMFNIMPENNLTSGTAELTNGQYSLIGIQADLATKNIDFNVVGAGPEAAMEDSIKYRMTVPELKSQHPDMYQQIIKDRAIPHVRELRNDYYHTLITSDMLCREVGVKLTDVPDTIKELERQKSVVEKSENTLQRAIKDTDIKYKSGEYDIHKDLEKIHDGKIQVEIGNTKYSSLKHFEESQGRQLAYNRVSYAQYSQNQEFFGSLEHSAFMKADTVNIVVTEKGREQILNFLDTLSKNHSGNTRCC